jgi:prepilin-type N-terminal cleavage/methylation domain-containing protein
MRRKSFTLLELIIVIVIVGILATLGLTQYGKMVERSRGAEARSILGDLRKAAKAYQLENGNLTNLANVNLNLGTGNTEIPTSCRNSHYFGYAFTVNSALGSNVTFRATRCSSGGKTPDAPTTGSGGQTLNLTANLSSGVDSWGGTGPWR